LIFSLLVRYFEYLSILVGETAAIMNELLLFNHLIKKCYKEKNIEMKILLINTFCDEFKGKSNFYIYFKFIFYILFEKHFILYYYYLNINI
jgi:oligoendopeptidase F